jgi:hypothetical protein
MLKGHHHHHLGAQILLEEVVEVEFLLHLIDLLLLILKFKFPLALEVTCTLFSSQG